MCVDNSIACHSFHADIVIRLSSQRLLRTNLARDRQARRPPHSASPASTILAPQGLLRKGSMRAIVNTIFCCEMNSSDWALFITAHLNYVNAYP